MDNERKSFHLSLVIPVYNSEAYIERSIGTVLAFFGQQEYDAEIIVVDDASTDGTRPILQRYDDRLQILTNNRNMGKGYSVRRGVLAAAGRFVFFTDADMPFTLEPIPRFLSCLDGQGFDVVIGARDPEENMAIMNPSWLRRIGSHLFTLLVSRVIVPGVSDTQCGLKGFRRSAAQALFSRSRIDRFAFDVEIMVFARALRLPVARLPVTVVSSAPSTVRPLRDGLIAAKDLAVIVCCNWLGVYK